MSKTNDGLPVREAILKDIRCHLQKAQMLMDEIEPSSIVAARLQLLIDVFGETNPERVDIHR